MKKLLILFFISMQSMAQSINGGWLHSTNENSVLIIATDKFVSFTEFTPSKFIKTWGGTYERQDSKTIHIQMEFNSADPSLVGTLQTYNLKIKKKSLTFDNLNFKYSNLTDALSGLWAITGRANDKGEMDKLTVGARRTYKLMSGGFFQWLAINVKTGEFSGTGGGTYLLKDGKYTERILFFSRDNTRIGAELQFDAIVNANEWIHSGKSSKGDPIKEIWTKQ